MSGDVLLAAESALEIFVGLALACIAALVVGGAE